MGCMSWSTPRSGRVNEMAEVLLKIDNLKKRFGKLEVLKGLSTEIRKGEVVVMIGPSGGGKSTFLRLQYLLIISVQYSIFNIN